MRILLIAVGLMTGAAMVATQGQDGGQSLATAIDQLVSFDYNTRTAAARTVRRTPAAQAIPALAAAARSHQDGYVRYRALVLLAGFGEASAGATMRALMGDPNDRVRAVVYAWYERHPSREVSPVLIAALETERSEFVRPALTRALAAAHDDPAVRAAVQPLITQGEDFFRGTVIEALGDYGAAWAAPLIADVARLDGPLQDDAITALGKLGDRSMLPVLASLQTSAPRDTQPSLAAATCLITRACAPHEDYLRKTLVFAAGDSQYQSLLRNTGFSLAVLAARGSASALTALLDVAEPATDPARAALALASGHVALRNPIVVLDVLEGRATRTAALGVLKDAFDMLNEDFEEERFFVDVRRAYWAAPEGSPRRAAAQALIDALEF
jgi:HEAT repeat protein